MTVAANDTIERFVIAGIGPYAYTWRIFNETDLQVYALSPASPPAPTQLTYIADYTVQGANQFAGGTVTLTATAAAAYVGYTIDIRSNTPEDQPTSIRNLARFQPEIHEDAYDYLSRQIQDLRRLVNETVRVPDNEPELAMILPPVATRIGKYSAFDSFGQPIVSAGTGNDAALRTDLANTTAGTEGALLVGARRSFTGSVARTLSSILAQQYWIEDVGAARGLTAPIAAANTAKIQALITAINASSSRCGVINVPTGTWPIDDTLTIPAGCTVSWRFESGAILYAVGFTANKPMLNYAGTALSPITGVFTERMWLYSDNGLARGITASYLIHYDLDVYFYSLANGFVGSGCYSGKFSNGNGDLITGDMVLFSGDDCNHVTFDTCRFLGTNGFLCTAYAHALAFVNCSVEGIINTTGAGLNFAPVTTKIIHGITITGLYSENVRSYAIAFAAADVDGVRNVSLTAPYLTGGYALHFGSVAGNAVSAIYLSNITGFQIIAPYVEDWQTNAFQVVGTVTDGCIKYTKRASVPNLFSASPGKSVEVLNNFSGRRVEFGTAPPGAGTYEVGDITWNTTPTAGKPIGWTCLTAGTPGTWMAFGASYLEGSAVYDPASLADAVGVTTTVTVTGAALGDFTEASFSLDLQGITLTTWVSAANTVSVRFQNESGGVLDLGSGTLRARVSRA